MSEMGLCEYCAHKYTCMTEEPCRSCSSDQGAFEFDIAEHDAKVRENVIDKVEIKLLENGFIWTEHALEVWNGIAKELKEQKK